MKFNIITTCFNAEPWIYNCIQSVKEQTCVNWKMVIIDDCSTDNTLEVIKQNRHPHIQFGQPIQKSGNLANQYQAISQFTEPGSIIIHLDGDDWLYDNDVLAHLKSVYECDPDLLVTYGNYLSINGQPSVCSAKPANESFRDSIIKGWRYSHLRTYRRFLFDLVKVEDLKDSNGNFFSSAGDVALFLPILEMAAERVYFCPRINAIYNNNTDINDHKVRLDDQVRCALEIFHKQPYNRLSL